MLLNTQHAPSLSARLYQYITAVNALGDALNRGLRGLAEVLDWSGGWPVGGMEVDLQAGEECLGRLDQTIEVVPSAMTGQPQRHIPPEALDSRFELRPAISANSAQTRTRRINIFGTGKDRQASAYVLTATVPAWSQHLESGHGGSAIGYTVIVSG